MPALHYHYISLFVTNLSSVQVYSWGLNLSGQLGHSEMSSVPAAIPVGIKLRSVYHVTFI